MPDAVVSDRRQQDVDLGVCVGADLAVALGDPADIGGRVANDQALRLGVGQHLLNGAAHLVDRVG